MLDLILQHLKSSVCVQLTISQIGKAVSALAEIGKMVRLGLILNIFWRSKSRFRLR